MWLVKVPDTKINNKLPIFNGGREAEVIHKNAKRLKNSNYESLIRKYFQSFNNISKVIQTKSLNKIIFLSKLSEKSMQHQLKS